MRQELKVEALVVILKELDLCDCVAVEEIKHL